MLRFRTFTIFLISNFRHVLNFVCILQGYSPASEFCVQTFQHTRILLCQLSNNSKLPSFQESPLSVETVASSSHNAFIKNCTDSNLQIFVVAVMANDSCYGVFDCHGHLYLENCERMHFFGEIGYSHDNVATTVDMHLTSALKDGGRGWYSPHEQHFTLNCSSLIY